MPRAFVTGAQGFTGRYLVPRLHKRGYEVHGLIRRGEQPDLEGPIEFHVGELTELETLATAIEKARPDVVIHLAGIAFVAHGQPRDIYDANLIGSRNLLEAILQVGIRPSSILLASSANVYGNQRSGALTEETPPEPVNEYGISKLAMELVARLFADELPIIIARPFNYTGVGQSVDFIIPKIIDHARRRAPSIELGNIDVERDFSDVRGVCDVYLRLIEEPGAFGQVFNVCSGRACSLRHLIGMVERTSGHKMTVSMNPAYVRSNEVAQLYGDNRKLIELLGPMSMPPLEDTLRWMLEA